jgi:hypothetical protein
VACNYERSSFALSPSSCDCEIENGERFALGRCCHCRNRLWKILMELFFLTIRSPACARKEFECDKPTRQSFEKPQNIPRQLVSFRNPRRECLHPAQCDDEGFCHCETRSISGFGALTEPCPIDFRRNSYSRSEERELRRLIGIAIQRPVSLRKKHIDGGPGVALGRKSINLIPL